MNYNKLKLTVKPGTRSVLLNEITNEINYNGQFHYKKIKRNFKEKYRVLSDKYEHKRININSNVKIGKEEYKKISKGKREDWNVKVSRK